MNIKDVAVQAHKTQVSKGFVEDGKPRNFGERIALAHSELSEALEGHREGIQNPNEDVKFLIEQEIESIKSTTEPTPIYTKYKGCVAFELADAIIRILGMTEEDSIENFEWYIEQKMKYNAKRPIKHGKAY